MSANADPGDDTRIGTVLDARYRVDRLIAVGGMGRVYRGVQVPAGRVCAIKILDERAAAGLDDFRARFEQETLVLAGITHPNVVQVFDSGVTGDGAPYLVMELVSGHTLREIVAREGPLEVGRAVRLINQASAGLRDVHARGIVHRDVKPSNLLVHQPDGPDGDEQLKVLDFGLTKRIENDPEITRPGTVVGSPMYMAPEQVEGAAITPATDVYALGVALFVALTGAAPFETGTPTELMTRHVREAPPSVHARRPEVPVSVARIVDRCLNKDPASRFASATELARALDAALVELGGGPVVPEAMLRAPVPGPWHVARARVRQLMRRRVRAPDPVSIVLVIALVAVVVAMVGAWWVDRTRASTFAAPEPRVPTAEEVRAPSLSVEPPREGADLVVPPFAPPQAPPPAPPPAPPAPAPSAPEAAAEPPPPAPEAADWPKSDIRDPWRGADPADAPAEAP